MPFTPRLTSAGMPYPWWEDGNKYYDSGNGLPNCTCYCYGRAAEILGGWDTNLPNGNGMDWFDEAVNAGYQTGMVPQLGAIMCFAPRTLPSTALGHVATVEVINQDGSVITSNSGYPNSYFFTETLYPGDGYLSSWMTIPARNYYLQGFIYNTDQPIPPAGPWGPWTLINYLRRKRKRRCGLT